MGVFPKFIIENGNLIISKCTYHKQLATNVKDVVGGGWYDYNPKLRMFTFFGDSHDFGRASIEDISECVKANKVFLNKRLIKAADVSNFSFRYMSDYEIVTLPQ